MTDLGIATAKIYFTLAAIGIKFFPRVNSFVLTNFCAHTLSPVCTLGDQGRDKFHDKHSQNLKGRQPGFRPRDWRARFKPRYAALSPSQKMYTRHKDSGNFTGNVLPDKSRDTEVD